MAHYNYNNTYVSKIQELAKYDLLRTRIIADTDHLFSTLEAQKALINVIHDWAVRVASKQKTATTEPLPKPSSP
jgi:hypothetical protein